MPQYNIDPFGKMMETERWISQDKLNRQQIARQNALQDIQRQSAQMNLTQSQDRQNALGVARTQGMPEMLQQYPVIGQSLIPKKAGSGSSTDIWKYANLAEQQWENENPDTPMPPQLKMQAMMNIKRAQEGETTRIKQAGADVDLNMQPKIKEKVKFAEMQGSQRSQRIDKAYTKVESLNKNLINIDNAIDAVKAGAGTGAIAKRFPSIRGTSILLDNVQGSLALDVIGSVTFGALSKGELDLAKDIAIPTGLEGPELIQWLQDKKAAQTKLIKYFQEQIEFIDKGGSVAGFLRSKERKNENVIRFDANGEIIQ